MGQSGLEQHSVIPLPPLSPLIMVGDKLLVGIIVSSSCFKTQYAIVLIVCINNSLRYIDKLYHAYMCAVVNRHIELFVDGNGRGRLRRLLQLSEEPGAEEQYHASMVEKSKWKQLNQELELKKAVDEWEKKYGAWVGVQYLYFMKLVICPACSYSVDNYHNTC